MRTTRDGRVVIGGEDEEFSDAEARDALLPRKIATIRAKLGRLFPQLDKVSISLRDIVAAFVGSLIILLALWLWDKFSKPA